MFWQKKSDSNQQVSRMETLPNDMKPFTPYIIFLLFFCVISFAKEKLKIISLSHDILLVSIGILLGVLIQHFENLKPYFYDDIDHANLEIIFLPTVIFWFSFKIDTDTFLNSINQILVISGPVSATSSCLLGLLTKSCIKPSWSYYETLIFAISCTPILPLQLITKLKNIGPDTKHPSVLLEGETIAGFGVFSILWTIVVFHYVGLVNHWYQILTIFVRLAGFGALSGLSLGFLGSLLLRFFCDDSITSFIITLSIPFIAFHLAIDALSGSGSVAVIFAGILMGKQRILLRQGVEEIVDYLWDLVFYTITSFICLRVIIFATIFAFSDENVIENIICGLMIYILDNIFRFLSFFVFAPILSRFGYGLSLSSMAICVWGSVKSNLGLFTAMTFRNNLYDDSIVILFVVYCLSVVINATSHGLLLKFLNISKVSSVRKINMDNCMAYIEKTKFKSIQILKMDKNMADVNWAKIIETTTIKHPYGNLKMKYGNGDNFFKDYSFSSCPDCKSEATIDTTRKLLRKMTRAAYMRILKMKQTSYIRQYANAEISKEALRMLTQAVKVAIDLQLPNIAVDELQKLFLKDNFISAKIKTHVNLIFGADITNRNIKMPRRPSRQIAYRLIRNKCFISMKYLTVFLNLIQISIEIYLQSTTTIQIILTTISTAFYLFYLCEFILKITAFSWIYIISHGFKTYFASKFNIFEFILLLHGFVDLIVNYSYTYLGIFHEIYRIFLFSRYLRGCRFLIFSRYCTLLHLYLVRYINAKSNYHVSIAYELGKAYVKGEEEVLELLPHVIEHEKTREEIRKRIEKDRLAVIRHLGIVQTNKPAIAVSIKTLQAIKIALSAMKQTLGELKRSGSIEEKEYLECSEILKQKISASGNLDAVPQVALEVLFRGVLWMGCEEDVVNFLYENAVVKKFSAGETICDDGEVSDGVYILISGVLKLSYTPKNGVLDNLKNYGCLPIVDYMKPANFERAYIDYIVSGNCVGILCTLTGRPYNCTIGADTDCQMFLLKRTIIQQAMAMSTDKINGLESRMWRSSSFEIAIPLLINTLSAEIRSVESLKWSLERAFVPNLSNFKYFETINEDHMIEDIVLVEGIIADFSSKKHYVAPCHIPRSVDRLVLPKSGCLRRLTVTESKLLVIPKRDVRDFALSVKEDASFDMVSTEQSRCILHVVQHQSRSWQTCSERKFEKTENEKTVSGRR